MKENTLRILFLMTAIATATNLVVLTKSSKMNRSLEERVTKVETRLDSAEKTLEASKATTQMLMDDLKRQATETGAKMQQVIDQAIADFKVKAEKTVQQLSQSAQNIGTTVNQEIDKYQKPPATV